MLGLSANAASFCWL